MSPAGGMPYPPGALPGAGGRMAGASPRGAPPGERRLEERRRCGRNLPVEASRFVVEVIRS